MAFGPYKDAISQVAAKYNIPAAALAGILTQESGWNPKAVGDKGKSFGMGQFNVKGALADLKLTPQQVLDMPAEQQIDYTGKFFRMKLDQAKGNVDRAIYLYNGGGDKDYLAKVHRRIAEGGAGGMAGIVSSGAGVAGAQAARRAAVRDAMQPMFLSTLDRMRADAKAQGVDFSIGSGYRTVARQNELWQEALKKYGSPEAARKWVAPPGHSSHNFGFGADLKFSSPKARQWVHDNADKYGIQFRVSGEHWHAEPKGYHPNMGYNFGAEAPSPQEGLANAMRPSQPLQPINVDITRPSWEDIGTSPGANMTNDEFYLKNQEAMQQLLDMQAATGSQPNSTMARMAKNPLLQAGLSMLGGPGEGAGLSTAQVMARGVSQGFEKARGAEAAEQEALNSQMEFRLKLQNAHHNQQTLAWHLRNSQADYLQQGIENQMKAEGIRLRQAELEAGLAATNQWRQTVGLPPIAPPGGLGELFSGQPVSTPPPPSVPGQGVPGGQTAEMPVGTTDLPLPMPSIPGQGNAPQSAPTTPTAPPQAAGGGLVLDPDLQQIAAADPKGAAEKQIARNAENARKQRDIDMQRQLEIDREARAAAKQAEKQATPEAPKLSPGYRWKEGKEGIEAEPIPGTRQAAEQTAAEEKKRVTLDTLKNTEKNIDTIMEMMSNPKIGTEAYGPHSGKYNILYGQIVADIAVLRNLGVIQPGEMQTIMEELPNPGVGIMSPLRLAGNYMKGPEQILASYKTLKEQFQTRRGILDKTPAIPADAGPVQYVPEGADVLD